jgi:para-aminobenzoate synthetase component 1
MIHLLTTRLELKRPLWQCADRFLPGPEQPTAGCCFLLDSAMDPGRLGRQSFLGARPVALITGKRLDPAEPLPARLPAGSAGDGRPFRLNMTVWKSPDGTVYQEPRHTEWVDDPFAALRRVQKRFRSDSACQDLQDGFQGGLVGYFGFEVAHAVENLPDTVTRDDALPDLAFMMADVVACEDHNTGEVTLRVTGRGPDEQTARRDARELASWWQERLTGGSAPAAREEILAASPCRVSAHFDQKGYCAAVQRCREHILAGDVFEVCLTHRLETPLRDQPWDLYRRLRAINPAPFASWLQFPDFQVVSASPERFLRLDAEMTAESRPIKGTRPRGTDAAKDRLLRDELAASEKDRAENLMIVDLVRNDLGRVARIGSVQVPELLVVEDYATVFQLVSTIQARLRPECDALDLVRSCYPGGSMTGAPKIEALKIIDGLEPVERGVYSGAIGYLDRRGTMDLSIVIRTIVCRNGRAQLGVGGAVVADSDPLDEYQETLDKARALLQALGAPLAGGGA